MKTLTAKDAKYRFGCLIDLARAEPVVIAKSSWALSSSSTSRTLSRSSTDCAQGADAEDPANKIYQPLKWSAELGVEAKKKTRTVLNRLWLDPRAELVDFADRSATLKTQPEIPIAALC